MRRLLASAAMVAVGAVAGPARGQLTGPPQRGSSASPTDPPGDEERLQRAKELFRQGVTVFEAGDIARAAEFFRRSRGLYPSARNTVNEALCLERLGRFDEALELYEEAITRFAGDLEERDRRAVVGATRVLRPKLGELEVASNVTGSVMIGSRPRGRLPLTAPIRVLPGRHVVRVLMQGYVSYEAIVAIEAGARKLIDARLIPLASAGGLRVEDVLTPQAAVVVDGAEVGKSPWEGMLVPGAHVVQSRTVSRVSAPVRVVVVQGQTVLARLRSGPVASAVTIHVEPSGAEILLNDVLVARGTWAAALPVGVYRVRLREEGYRTQKQSLALHSVEGPPRRLDARLEVDPGHPRWPRPPPGKLWLGAWAGLVAGPTLRSGPEARCPDACSSDPPAIGFLGGLRAGYELPVGLSIEVGAGYLSLRRTIVRTESNGFPAHAPTSTVTYDLTDKLRLRGPFVGGGASWGLGPLHGLTLRTRLTAGVLFASSFDALTGRASTGEETVEVGVEGASGNATSRALFVMPALGLEKRVGAWDVGAGLGVWFLPMEGPDLPHNTLTVSRANCSLANPGAVSCAPAYGGVEGERAYGPFAVIVPQVTGRYRF